MHRTIDGNLIAILGNRDIACCGPIEIFCDRRLKPRLDAPTQGIAKIDMFSCDLNLHGAYLLVLATSMMQHYDVQDEQNPL